MQEHKYYEEDYSFYDLFVPLTTKKVIIFIIAIGFIVFFNMLFNGFVWDDFAYIVNNPEIHTFNLIHLFGVNNFNSAGYYRPIPAIYFSLIYIFFGTQSFFYHFPQLILHIVNTCLLFYFLKKFFRIGTAFFLSVIFLVHPIQVESVAFIGASQSELFFFFGILALLFSFKKVIHLKGIIIISFLLFLSLLTKETGILFIFMMLVFQYFYYRKRTGIFLISGIIISGIYLFTRFVLARVPLEKSMIPFGKFSLLERSLNIPAIIYYYIKTFFYPAKLSIDQLWTIKTIGLQSFYYPLVIDLLFFLSIGLLGVYIYKKANRHLFKLYFFFLLWFCVGLVMLLQLYPLDMTVSERWFYFPIVGLLGMFGVLIETAKPANNNIKNTAYIVAVCILIVLSLRTMVRNTNWVNALTLYSHDSTVSDNYDIESNLGTELVFAHQYKDGFSHFEKSVEEYPTVTNLYDLGYMYEQFGNYMSAEKYYRLAVEEENIPTGQNVVLQNAYNGLARVLTAHDKPATAKAFLEKAIKKYPTNATYWADLAWCEYSLNEQPAALVSAEKAKTLVPNDITGQLYKLIKDKQLNSIRNSE